MQAAEFCNNPPDAVTISCLCRDCAAQAVERRKCLLLSKFLDNARIDPATTNGISTRP
jgi:hypothetical protein